MAFAHGFRHARGRGEILVNGSSTEMPATHSPGVAVVDLKGRLNGGRVNSAALRILCNAGRIAVKHGVTAKKSYMKKSYIGRAAW